MDALLASLSKFGSNSSSNLLHVDISSQALLQGQEVCVGVDEAGRGPVLGPMVYAAYASFSESELRSTGAADSKTLDESRREQLLTRILDSDLNAALAMKILSPVFITESMYRRSKYNLNSISHDAAMEIVDELLKKGVIIKELFVDTVGPPEKYQAKLERRFPQINQITVSKKADAKFPCVSAASICAKVSRDRVLSQWEKREGLELGSGYPGDPVTKKFLNEHLDPMFGFKSVVRASWKTAEKIVNDRGIEMSFEEFEPDDEDDGEFEATKGKRRKQTKLNHFFAVNEKGDGENKEKSEFDHIFFKERNLNRNF